MEGWISLHRKIRRNPIFNDMELFRLWIICLTEATHKERDQIIGRQTVHLLPGQFVTGRYDLQAMYNLGLKSDQQKSPKTVWRWLEALEKGEFLTINSTNKFSVISIDKWHKYQKDDHEFDQQVTIKRPSNDHQVTTNNNVNNDNNENNVNKKDLIPYSEIIDYLNQKAGTKYKPNSKTTQKHIKARWNDKFRLEDFKTVIDKKTAEWLGTEWEQYLRPETLFGTKFENYLNQKIVLKGGQNYASRTEARRETAAVSDHAHDAKGSAKTGHADSSGSRGAHSHSEYDLNLFVRR